MVKNVSEYQVPH